jgi:uncharacterized protein YdeI (YjbR/CyaY-like superfamily)
MGKRIPEVDAYIRKAAPFAQPILEKIRDNFHAASAEIDEAMKWSAPFFEYKGVLGQMAAFKSHVSWGFWKAELMGQGATMRGFRVTDVEDLPSKKEMVELVRKAMRLNDEGVKVERAPSTRSAKPLQIPSDLAAAMKKDKKARSAFDSFSPSQQREYVEWLEDAKQAATRQKRLATAMEWIGEGKTRHWKYQK